MASHASAKETDSLSRTAQSTPHDTSLQSGARSSSAAPVVSGQRVKLDMARRNGMRTSPAWRFFIKYSIPKSDGNNVCCNVLGDDGVRCNHEMKHVSKDGTSILMKHLHGAHAELAKEVLAASRHSSETKQKKGAALGGHASHLHIGLFLHNESHYDRIAARKAAIICT